MSSDQGFQIPPMVQLGSAYGGRGPAVLATAWTGLSVTTILITGRLYLRFQKGRQEKEHDVSLGFALFSWVSSLNKRRKSLLRNVIAGSDVCNVPRFRLSKPWLRNAPDRSQPSEYYYCDQIFMDSYWAGVLFIRYFQSVRGRFLAWCARKELDAQELRLAVVFPSYQQLGDSFCYDVRYYIPMQPSRGGLESIARRELLLPRSSLRNVWPPTSW